MIDAEPPGMPPVRVVLCTSGGVFGAIVLHRLLASPGIEVVGLILSSRVLRADYAWLRGACAQIRRSGPRYALYLWSATGLADLVGRYTAGGSVGSLAAAHRVPVHVTRNLNDNAGRAFIAARLPQVLLSAFFNQRIDPATYAIPECGALNIHPSLLPDFRGVDPVFFARLRGASLLGVSVHRIDASLDTGPILAQAEWQPGDDDSVLRITAELYARGAALATRQLRARLPPNRGRAQAGHGSYDSWPRPQDVARFRRNGGRLVCWRDLLDLAQGSMGRG